VLFGARFGGSGSFLRILAAAVVPMFINAVFPYAMIARRRPAPYVWINVAALTLNVGANLVLIPVYGPTASAWLTVLTEFLVLALSLSTIRRTLGYVPSARPPILAVVAAIVAALAHLALRPFGAAPAYAGFAFVLVALFWWFRLISPAHLRGAFAPPRRAGA
jgi:O-antigen/teichoic acid export membrane protein